MRSYDPLDQLIRDSLQAAYGDEHPSNRPYERLMARLRKETLPRVPAPVLVFAGALVLVVLLMPPKFPSSPTARWTPPPSTDPAVQVYTQQTKPGARIPLAWLIDEPNGIAVETPRAEWGKTQ